MMLPSLLTILHFLSLILPLHGSITAKNADIPVVSIGMLSDGEKSKSTTIKAREALTTLGILQLTNVPNYASARKKSLQGLALCLQSDITARSMAMNDGSRRLSAGAASLRGEAGKFNGYCGDDAHISELRDIIDGAVRQLFRSLDLLDPFQNDGATELLMKPYATYEQIIDKGEHLEHLHAYYSAANEVTTTTATTDRGHSGRSKNKNKELPALSTVDFHTDGGLFIAMTAGLYQNPSRSDVSKKGELLDMNITPAHQQVAVDAAAGLYIRLPDGSAVKANIDDDAIVVMVGEAGARWLSPQTRGSSSPSMLRAVPHAMVAGLLPEGVEGVEGEGSSTRAWYGKMFMPPADALIKSQVLASLSGQPEGVDELQYSEYRSLEKQVLALMSRDIPSSSSSSSSSSSYHHDAAHSDNSTDKEGMPGMLRGARASTRDDGQKRLRSSYEIRTQQGEVNASSFSSSSSRLQLPTSAFREIQNLDHIKRMLLPVACGADSTKLVDLVFRSSSDACTASGGTDGIMCWAQCVSTSNLVCSSSQSIECVDTADNNAMVDGSQMCPGTMVGCEPMCITTDSDIISTTNSTNNSTTISRFTTSKHQHTFCYGTGTSMNMLGFQSQIVQGPGNTPCINLLFPTWTLDTRGKFAGACIGTLFIGILIGLITKLRVALTKVFRNQGRLYDRLKIVISAFLLAVNLTLGYFDMLIAMTYNAELFVMVVLGLAIGYLIFNSDSALENPEGDSIPCCNDNDTDTGIRSMANHRAATATTITGAALKPHPQPPSSVAVLSVGTTVEGGRGRRCCEGEKE